MERTPTKKTVVVVVPPRRDQVSDSSSKTTQADGQEDKEVKDNQLVPPVVAPDPDREELRQLCCCNYQTAVFCMASLDLFISVAVGLVSMMGPEYEDKLSEEENAKTNLYAYLVMSSATVFMLFSILLIGAAIWRNKVLCWIFIIGDGIAYLGCTITYLVQYWKIAGDSQEGYAILLLLSFFYKIYETIVVIYFTFEKPSPPITISNVFVSGGNGVFYVTGRPVYYYESEPAPYVDIGLLAGAGFGATTTRGFYY